MEGMLLKIKMEISVRLSVCRLLKRDSPLMHATMADKPEVRARRYRLMWNDVKYEPGELKVVAYGADGNKVGETSIHTAGKAAAVALKADKTVLLSIALNVSRRQMIAPVPLGTEALSSSLKAPVICVGGLMLFLISMGCS